METQGTERLRKSTLRHLAMEAGATIERITGDLPDHPGAMGYFYEILKGAFSGDKPHIAGGAMIGTLCMQVPEELIHALGGIPVRLCSGAHAFEQIGAELLPAKACPVVKATMGTIRILRDGGAGRFKCIVIPTTCDQKKKLGEMLQDMGIPVYFLEVPPNKDSEEAKFYWYNSVKRFASDLQRIMKRRLSKKELQKSIHTCNQARVQFRRFWNLLGSVPSVIYGTDGLLVTNAYLFDSVEGWTEAVKNLNDELESRREEGKYLSKKRVPRLLLTGSPPIFPNLKVPILAEQAGALLVADEACSSSRLLYDTVSYDEGNLYDLLPGIADRYLRPGTCPYLVPNPDRGRRLLDMTEKFSVDGVIYQSYAGCNLYEMEQRKIGKILADRDIPMLYLETDYGNEDIGQLSTRIDAFVESLQNRKKEA